MPQTFRIPPESVVLSVREAYERGQSLDAFRLAEAFAPLHQWGGIEACALAVGIASNCGGQGLATRLSGRMWRQDKTHPVAQLYYGLEIAQYRGPLALWLAMRQWPPHREGPPEQLADLLGLRARTAIDLRDFDVAEDLLNQAESTKSRLPWVLVQRSYLFERQDRVEEALAAAEDACASYPHPIYRLGVQIRAHLLQLLDRDDDAIRLLSGADAVLQNYPIRAQLYALQAENGLWADAQTTLDRFVDVSPLLEALGRKWVEAQRARVAYHLGKRSEAANYAALVDDDFHKEFAAKLAQPAPNPERVHLDVTFVRQHFKTCAPATLAALGRFWGMPAEHLKVAEAICYDGTPHWDQREWARKNGWFVRDFQVTWDSAVALLTRDIPFAVSAVEPSSAHMQAAIGFDLARGTLLLRDPSQPYVGEAAAEPFLDRYKPLGPHGTVFLPLAEASRLEGLVLPDADVYDDFHDFCLALERYERGKAAELLAKMEQSFPGHRLTWEARLNLANYDANVAQQAEALDKLLELFPDSPVWLLRRFWCRQDAPRQERIDFLKQACSAPAADPLLYMELARALLGDARFLQETHQALNRAFRGRPMDPNIVGTIADLKWNEGNLDQATELYRFAANLEGFREDHYRSWFIACRKTRRTAEAMAHLRDRFARFGSKSGQPALTLAWALRETEDSAAAQEVLAEARRLRPDDGWLLIKSASLLSGFGNQEEAGRLLEAGRSKVRENDWLRTAAEMAEHRVDLATALKWYRELLGLEPLALDGQAGIARCLARMEGNAAALGHLRSECARHPHHYGLHRMLVDWSNAAGPSVQEAMAREFLQTHPADASVRRDLAIALCNLKRPNEALPEALEAARIEPRSSFTFSTLGFVYRELQQLPEAREQLRRAVKLSVDNTYAIHALLELGESDKDRREELAFVQRELVEQVVEGEGLRTFVEFARSIMEPTKILDVLRQAHAERPDLWHAWGALISQLGHMGELAEALATAQQATRKFPHVPGAWLDLARVHRWRNDSDQEINAAEHAFEMNPGWNKASLVLANALERRGRMKDAQNIYERALKHSRDDAPLEAFYAHLLWRVQDKDGAFAAIERALRLAPAYDWAWSSLIEWANASGDVTRPAALARSLTSERPGEPKVWLKLAHVLSDPAALPERLRAIEKAVELDIYSNEAWDLKAETLALAERFSEAIQACEEGLAVCTVDRHALSGRRAWIEAQRGNLSEAVERMRAVLAENSIYAWGWHELAHYLIEQKAFTDAAAALETLLRFNPRDPWVHRQLGFLRLKEGNKEAAQKHLAATLELEPTDIYSAQNIFDLQLQAGDKRGAAETLRLMETHQPGTRTLAAAAALHLEERDCDAATRCLSELCASPDPNPGPLTSVTDHFIRVGWQKAALRVVRRSLKAGACNPQTGSAAIKLLLSKGRVYLAAFLFERLEPGIRRKAAVSLITGLVNLQRKRLVNLLTWRWRDMLREDDEAWGQVGYAFSSFDQVRRTLRWLADWQFRPNVQPWMVFNFCLALRQVGRYDEATAASRFVLEKWGHRAGSADMHLFLAVEEALAGDLPAAQQHLERVVVRKDTPYDQQLLAIANAVVKFRQTPENQRPATLKSIRSELSKHVPIHALRQTTKDIRRTLRRGFRVFAREGGGWRARLWVLRTYLF